MRRVRQTGSAVTVALALMLAACGGDSEPRGESTDSSPSAKPTPTETTAPPSSEPSAVPSYTPPPSRTIPRPPGLPALGGDVCGSVAIQMHGAVGAWYSAAASYAEDGNPVPADEFASSVRVMPSFLKGPRTTRTELQAAGVPAGFVVFQDLTEAERAIQQSVTVAQASDDSKVMAVYFRIQTANDRLVESCGVLEG